MHRWQCKSFLCKWSGEDCFLCLVLSIQYSAYVQWRIKILYKEGARRRRSRRGGCGVGGWAPSSEKIIFVPKIISLGAFDAVFNMQKIRIVISNLVTRILRFTHETKLPKKVQKLSKNSVRRKGGGRSHNRPPPPPPPREYATIHVMSASALCKITLYKKTSRQTVQLNNPLFLLNIFQSKLKINLMLASGKLTIKQILIIIIY